MLAGLFLMQGFKDRLIHDLDKILLEIADETFEKYWTRRGVTWEDAIQHMESRYSNHQPFIQMVEIGEKEDHKITKVIASDRVPEGTFLLCADLYYKADRTDIEDLIFKTLKEEELNSYPLRIVLMPVRGPNILQVGISMEETTQAVNQLIVVLILAGILLLLFASLGGGFIIGRALRPVKSIVKTAQHITADDLSLRIDVKNRGDEIGALVETFNAMIERLDKSVNKIRQFSGDVSHELRTPLTIIRGEIEVLLRKKRNQEEYLKTMQSVLEESFRMEKIINDLLFLSRVEAMDHDSFKDKVQLDEVVDEVLTNRRQALESKNLTLESADLEATQAQGNRDLIERMISNLIDNAVRYTSPGGSIAVILNKHEDKISLEISDTGIGIPEGSIKNIFDRFFVVDKSRSKETGGVGLGLSIVKWIADNHNIKIEVRSKLNQGSVFILWFPVAD